MGAICMPCWYSVYTVYSESMTHETTLEIRETTSSQSFNLPRSTCGLRCHLDDAVNFLTVFCFS